MQPVELGLSIKMDQLFEQAEHFNFLLSEGTTCPNLPVISPNEIDGILAQLENRPPLTPFSEVRNIFFL